MTSPTKRGFSTLLVKDAVKARLDSYRGVTEAKPKGDMSQSDALTALLDRFESAGQVVPLDSLEPITAALHELERQIPGGRFHSTEELAATVRSIRKQIEALP